MDLTEARLTLLRDVASPRVVVQCRRSERSGAWRVSWRYDPQAPSPERRRNVSARCDELERAGWIEMDDPRQLSAGEVRHWRLTEIGRALLAEPGPREDDH